MDQLPPRPAERPQSPCIRDPDPVRPIAMHYRGERPKDDRDNRRDQQYSYHSSRRSPPHSSRYHLDTYVPAPPYPREVRYERAEWNREDHYRHADRRDYREIHDWHERDGRDGGGREREVERYRDHRDTRDWEWRDEWDRRDDHYRRSPPRYDGARYLYAFHALHTHADDLTDRYTRRHSPPHHRRILSPAPSAPTRRISHHVGDTYIPSRSRSPNGRPRATSRGIHATNSDSNSPRDIHRSNYDSTSYRARSDGRTRASLGTTKRETSVEVQPTASVQADVSRQGISSNRKRSSSPRSFQDCPPRPQRSRSREQRNVSPALTPLSSIAKEIDQPAILSLKQQDGGARPQSPAPIYGLPSKPAFQLKEISIASAVPSAPRSQSSGLRPDPSTSTQVQRDEPIKYVPTEPRRSTPSGPRVKEEPTVHPSRNPPVIPTWQPKVSLTPELDADLARLRRHRTVLIEEQLKNAAAVRRSIHELELSSVDLRLAEQRRRVADLQLEQARAGSLGVNYDQSSSFLGMEPLLA